MNEKLLSKKVSALTYKAYNFISEEIENNPDKFKQRLSDKELRNARIKNAAKLQARNKKTREKNIKRVRESIATGKHYKSDGKTLNVTSVANATGLSRVTIKKIVFAIHTLST